MTDTNSELVNYAKVNTSRDNGLNPRHKDLEITILAEPYLQDSVSHYLFRFIDGDLTITEVRKDKSMNTFLEYDVDGTVDAYSENGLLFIDWIVDNKLDNRWAYPMSRILAIRSGDIWDSKDEVNSS